VLALTLTACGAPAAPSRALATRPVAVAVVAEPMDGEETVVTEVPDGCAGLAEEQADFEASGRGVTGNEPGGEDHAYPPDCTALTVDVMADEGAADAAAVPPWSRPVGWCSIQDSIYGPIDCEVAFGWGGAVASVELAGPMAHAEAHATVVERDVIPGGRHEAIVRLVVGRDDAIAVCRVTPSFGCTAALALTGNGWAATAKVERGAIVVAPVDNSAPPPGVVGRHPLVFLPPRPVAVLVPRTHG